MKWKMFILDNIMKTLALFSRDNKTIQTTDLTYVNNWKPRP